MTLAEARAQKTLTLQDLKHIDSDYLTPAVAAKILRCCPYSINVQAHDDASKLGYPVCVQGRRVRIPRLPFINYMEGQRETGN